MVAATTGGNGAVAPGTKLVVTTTHNAPCVLEGFSEDGIECGFRGRTYWVDRALVAQVSLEKRSHAVAVGTVIGAAAGGAKLVAARFSGNASAKTSAVLIGMGLGGWLGYGIGRLAPRSEGVVVYDAGP